MNGSSSNPSYDGAGVSFGNGSYMNTTLNVPYGADIFIVANFTGLSPSYTGSYDQYIFQAFSYDLAMRVGEPGHGLQFASYSGNHNEIGYVYSIDGTPGDTSHNLTQRTLIDCRVQYGGSGTFGFAGNYARPFYGVINEFIMFSSEPSYNDILKIQGYLAWKWNINNMLPSNHPYYSAPPN
jgi:hypothetical protein